MSQDMRPASSRGQPTRPVTSGGQRPTTGIAGRPTSRRGSAVASNSGSARPFSRQGSAIGGRPLGSAMGGGRLGSAMHRTTVPGTASRLQGKYLTWGSKAFLVDFLFSFCNAKSAHVLIKRRNRPANSGSSGRSPDYATGFVRTKNCCNGNKVTHLFYTLCCSNTKIP